MNIEILSVLDKTNNQYVILFDNSSKCISPNENSFKRLMIMEIPYHSHLVMESIQYNLINATHQIFITAHSKILAIQTGFPFCIVKQGRYENELILDQFIGFVSDPFQVKILSNELKNIDDTNCDFFLSYDMDYSSDEVRNLLLKRIANTSAKCQFVLELNNLKEINTLRAFFTAVTMPLCLLVIKAESFRESGIQLSQSKSWDKTLEDILKALESDSKLKLLKEFGHLLIRFGHEAVFYRSRLKDHHVDRFIYLPGEIETESQSYNPLAVGSEAFYAALISNLIKLEELECSDSEKICRAVCHAVQAGHRGEAGILVYSENSKSVDFPAERIFNSDISSVKIVDVTDFTSGVSNPSILQHMIFNDTSLILSNAIQFVKTGKALLFDAIPYLKVKNLLTYVPSEIEAFRSIYFSIQHFIDDKSILKPMSIGVFGPPGSGKSFGVKQLAKSIQENALILEFNLSQFQSYSDLAMAFQKVRDECVMGKVPFVFFDEFDCDCEGRKLGWLRYFLAPMQDGMFKDGESMHPVGRAIYIFAGGSCSSFEIFEGKINDPSIDRGAKLPDFVSRLKAFINIQGINQLTPNDVFYPLRRAIVLRNLLLHHADHHHYVHMDDGLLGALLEIPGFKHGARSLETIIQQSRILKGQKFSNSHLPPEQVLSIHVDIKELDNYMENKIIPHDSLEILASKIHENWLKGELEKGSNKTSMKPWDELNEEFKNSNRQQAMDMIRKLQAFGYNITNDDKSDLVVNFTEEEVEQMAIMEHNRWFNEKITNGWIYGITRNDELKIHNDLLPYEELDEPTKDNDRKPIRNIPLLMSIAGLKIYRETIKNKG